MDVLDWGRIDYGRAHKNQIELHKKRVAGLIPDTIILCEHPPTITIGRAGSYRNILCSKGDLNKKGISIYEVERGGDVTYHGPGQLVVYPIFDLKQHGRSIRRYLYNLEEIILKFLSRYNLKGERINGLTGVWVGGEKIAAIGIAISRWITYHGFSLNLSPHLAHFELIIPCGIENKKVTSLSLLLNRKIGMEDAKRDITEIFKEVFNEK